MSLESTLSRIGQIESMFQATAAPQSPASGNAAGGTSSASFATQLQQASSAQSLLGGGAGQGTNGSLPGAAATAGATGLTATGLPAGAASGAYGAPAVGAAGTGNQTMVSIAASQIGQAETPDGSNNGPAISMYRTATVGAMAGEPWCAYFASWVARQAGVPLGDQGQGFGAVSQIWSWAQAHGRAVSNGPGVVPKPGDLIVFGSEHVGIVDRVLPNGDIQTIEGNYSNKVSQVVRSPTEATGYVRMS
jgi:hypothetical protein